MKKIVRLNENDLRRMIMETLEGIDYSNIDFSKTPGIDLSDTLGDDDPDGSYYYSPKEIKEAVKSLQDSLQKVMDMMNGTMAGRNFSKAMWNKCLDFYNFISRYYIELKQECRDINGSWTEDHTDIPFIRQYGDDSSIPPYYGKNGKMIGDEHFKSDYKPHKNVKL